MIGPATFGVEPLGVASHAPSSPLSSPLGHKSARNTAEWFISAITSDNGGRYLRPARS